jgi:hypothetical protein
MYRNEYIVLILKDFGMFRLSDVEIQANSEALLVKKTPPSKTLHRRVVHPLLEVLILLLMSVLLFCSTFWQIFATPTDVKIYQPIYSDAAKYQCHVVAFWQGTKGVNALPTEQCLFLQTDIYPFLYVVPNWTVPFQPAFYPLVLVRDAIMLGIILVMLYRATRKSLLLSEGDLNRYAHGTK